MGLTCEVCLVVSSNVSQILHELQSKLLKEVIKGLLLYRRLLIGVIREDTRSLDYSSHSHCACQTDGMIAQRRANL